MKRKQTIYLVLLVLAGTMLLSACGGNSSLNNASSWPGVTAANGVVYTANMTFVEAVRDGQRLWFYPSVIEGRVTDLFFAAPTVVDGVVYAGTYSNQVHLLNAEDGTLKSRIVLPDPKHKVLSSVLVEDEMIYIPSSNSSIYAYEKDATAEPVWATKLSNEVWSTPALVGGKLYAATLDKKIHVLDPQDGSLLKSIDTDGAIMDGFVVADGKLYFSTFGKRVEVLDPETDSVMPVISADYEIWGAPAISGDLIVVVDMQGTVYAHSLESGNERWKKATVFGENMRVIARPVVLPNDEILVVSENGDMIIFDQDGKSTDSRSIAATVATTPVLDDETVVVALLRADSLLRGYTLDLKEDWIYAGTKDLKAENAKATEAASLVEATPETTEGK